VFNAVVKSVVPLERRAQDFDTVSFCVSKCLGAPVGSILCGTGADMHRARRVRKMLGGGMRQSGVLAAACLYALDHNIERLADDHRRARQLAMGLLMEGFDVKLGPTNIIYVTVPDAPMFQAQLDEKGVRCLAVAPNKLRLVTHMDVTDAGISQALDAMLALRR